MKRAFLTLLAAAALALLPSCSSLSGVVKETATDRQATGKILQVTSQPASLGYNRLGYHSAVYPELAQFLAAKGYPDFLVEDKTLTTRQVVVFYLKPNQAYLFQMKEGIRGQKMSVNGPEPIGKKTRIVLNAIRHLGDAPSDMPLRTVKKKAKP
ncbi:MAG: hypothetical protein JWO08_849 [Verrucomicrobiaceae bacterium]|nr:hypothetical protein [Verrucomicrobiaceae bacterium]